MGASQRALWSYPTLNYSRKTPSKNVGSASLSPLIGLIHDFTAHEAGATHAACRFCGQGCHRLAPISAAPEEAGGDLGGLPSPGLDEGGREGREEGKKSKLNESDNLQTFLPAAAQHSP